MPSASVPAAIATTAVAASAIGGAVSAYSAIQNADAQKAAASYQAQVAENQQQIQQEQAKQASQAGEAAAEQQSLKTRAAVGQIEASQAASGLDVNSGSALQTRMSETEVGQLNAMTVGSNFARQAYGYESGAVASGSQAGLYRQEAAQAPIAGAFGAAGSLLSGASAAGSQYMRWQQVGGSGAVF